MVLNKRRFKAFRKQWDDQASDDASEEFDTLLDSQGRHNLQTVLEADIQRQGSESADEQVEGEVEQTVTEVDGDLPEVETPSKRPSLPSSSVQQYVAAGSTVPYSENRRSARTGSSARFTSLLENRHVSEGALAQHDLAHGTAPMDPGPSEISKIVG